MRLKEQITKIVLDIPLINSPTKKEISDYENVLSNLEQLADEFAIGFTEFSINYNYHPMHKVWIKYDKIANERFTTKELLQT